MKNIHLIEKFMEENGLEYDVPFKIVIKPTIGETDFDTVYIHKDDNMYIGFTLNYADSDEVVEGDRFDIIDLLFADNVKIIKKPWKPKYDDIYWYASIDGYVYSSAWTNHNNDLHRYILGNCFKTKKEAEKYRRDVFKMLDGEPLVKWDD